MKNRHIGLQIINLAKLIEQQGKLGWYEIEILSLTESNPKSVQNGVFSVKFARLDGSGKVKYYRVHKDGQVNYIGE